MTAPTWKETSTGPAICLNMTVRQADELYKLMRTEYDRSQLDMDLLETLRAALQGLRTGNSDIRERIDSHEYGEGS